MLKVSKWSLRSLLSRDNFKCEIIHFDRSEFNRLYIRRDILDLDLALPAEKVHQVADVAVAHANAAVSELRRLFLVEDFVDSLKFGVLLWCLTYVGSWFNGMTLIIIGKFSRTLWHTSALYLLRYALSGIDRFHFVFQEWLLSSRCLRFTKQTRSRSIRIWPWCRRRSTKLPPSKLNQDLLFTRNFTKDN